MPATPTITHTTPAISMSAFLAFSLTVEETKQTREKVQRKEKRPPTPAAFRFLDCSFGNSLARVPGYFFFFAGAAFLAAFLAAFFVAFFI